jgi:hypothetical protein
MRPKLTRESAMMVRHLKIGEKSASKRFGISTGNVWYIRAGWTWKDTNVPHKLMKTIESENKLIEFNGKIPYVFDYEKS